MSKRFVEVVATSGELLVLSRESNPTHHKEIAVWMEHAQPGDLLEINDDTVLVCVRERFAVQEKSVKVLEVVPHGTNNRGRPRPASSS